VAPKEGTKRSDPKPEPEDWYRMGDDKSRTRVYFDEGTPEEYMLFEGAAVVVLFDYNGDAAQEKQLKTMLGNHALAVAYAGRKANYGNAESVFVALRGSFGGKTSGRALSELARLRQGQKEISEHILDFNRLAAQAGLSGETKMRMFIDTLNEGMKIPLTVCSETDFIGLAEKAREIGPAIDRQWRRSQPKEGGRNRFQKKDKVNSAQEKPARDLSTITCYNCDKKGHYKRDCTAPKKESGRKTQDKGPHPSKAPARSEYDEEEEN
jgi:Zinc knuckle/Retrotransposon gag protein